MDTRRELYIERCARRCLRYRPAVQPLVERYPQAHVAPCVVLSIALLEMGGRSAAAAWAERLLFEAGLALARAGTLPGVPDISIGPFQMRPSAAFGWDRVRTPFGHVAAPRDGYGWSDLRRSRDLLSAPAAVPLLVNLLAAFPVGAAVCSTLGAAHALYRGRPFGDREIDAIVLARIHDALHGHSPPGVAPRSTTLRMALPKTRRS